MSSIQYLHSLLQPYYYNTDVAAAATNPISINKRYEPFRRLLQVKLMYLFHRRLFQKMRNVTVTLFALASVSLLCQGFVSKQYQNRHLFSQSMSTVVNEADLPQLGLTPELEKYVNGFRSVADDKVRYQQLFFLASKCLPMDDALKLDQNKVRLISYQTASQNSSSEIG
jgi:hypothetical protein